MRISLMLAAGLTAITTVAHVVGGTPEFMAPIMESNAPDFNKTGMAIIWHWVTAVLCINTVALIIAGRGLQSMRALIWIVIAQSLAFGLIFAGYGSSAFGSLFIMPQWIAFFLIAALAFYGLRAETKAE